MPPADLVTKEQVKEYLKITSAVDDALFDSLIDRCSDFIRTYLGRTITDEGSITEDHDGLGRNYIVLQEYPILVLTSVSDDPDRAFAASSDIALGDLIQEDELGIIRRKFGVPFLNASKNVRVVYTAGYAAVPGAIEQATIELVASKYRKKDHLGVQSRSLKDGSKTYFSTRDFSTEIQTLLSPFRRESR
jgi:hypothetical protein